MYPLIFGNLLIYPYVVCRQIIPRVMACFIKSLKQVPIHQSTWLFIYLSDISICPSIHPSSYPFIYTRAYVCTYAFLYACMYVYMCVCVFVCIVLYEHSVGHVGSKRWCCGFRYYTLLQIKNKQLASFS